MVGGWTPVAFKVVGNYGGSKLPPLSYLILFPEVDPTCHPSPCKPCLAPTSNPWKANFTECEYSTETKTPGSPGSEFVRYEQFLRRELPGRVTYKLESRNDLTQSRKAYAESWSRSSVTCSFNCLSFTRPREI